MRPVPIVFWGCLCLKAKRDEMWLCSGGTSVAKGSSCSVYRVRSFEGRVERCVKHYEFSVHEDFLALLDLMRCPRGLNVPIVYQWQLASTDQCFRNLKGSDPKINSGSEHGLVIEEEWIEGRTLRKMMEDVPGLVVANAGKWAAQLATTLDRLHEHYGFVHHDLKPENVIIDVFGEAVLIDFDAARRLKSEEDGRNRPQSQVFLRGTKGYAAPEMVLFPEKTGRRADLYSFGKMFLEIVAIQPHGFKPGVHEVLKKCVRVDPQARFETAGALKAALECVF